MACSVLWVIVAFVTRSDSDESLDNFYRTVRPGGWWGPIASRCSDVVIEDQSAARRWLGFAAGVVFLYASLVGMGHLLTGRPGSGGALLVLGILTGFVTLSVATGRPEPRAPVASNA